MIRPNIISVRYVLVIFGLVAAFYCLASILIGRMLESGVYAHGGCALCRCASGGAVLGLGYASVPLWGSVREIVSIKAH
jgi:hypothetical protein